MTLGGRAVEPETRRFWWIAATLAAVVGGVMLFGRAREELEPTPRRAWVAIEAAGSGIARVGAVEIDAGGDFELHAVLEAEGWQGQKVYYTHASRLELPDGEVEPGRLRRWTGGDQIRVLWFSVEAARPYLEVARPEDLTALEFREFFLADWPRTWSVSGRWGATSAGVSLPRGVTHLPFGTRRFHVRVEIFGPESEIRPRQRLQSWSGAELRAHLDRFPTVLSRLPGALGPPSAAFGLPQLEPAPGAGPEALRAVAEWRRDRLGFSRLSLIKAAIEATGADPERLEWQAVELDGEAAWESPGELVRVGDRWVLTYQDRGIAERLDDDDLCFDFDKGAAIRRLGDIFVGDGLVERARLGEERDG